MTVQLVADSRAFFGKNINDITVEIMAGPSATVCYVTTGDGGFSAYGEAKCMPADENDPEVGQALALGRALEILAQDLQEYAIKKSFAR